MSEHERHARRMGVVPPHDDATEVGGPRVPHPRVGAVRLSIIMPAYNEERTIASAAGQVLATDFPCPIELIVVNDGSHDGTLGALMAIDDDRMTIVSHPRNFGKGAALFTGAIQATGTHLVPFDADLEYDPEDLVKMLVPVIKGRCQVVYGTRLFGQNTVYQSYHYALGNKLTTLAANVLFNSAVSDLHTCLKLVPVELFRSLPLRETGFGLDTEITANLLARGVRPFEVPVSYHSRSHAEGKKISWRDGVECLGVLSRVRLSRKRGGIDDATVDDPIPTPAPQPAIHDEWNAYELRPAAAP